MLSILAKSFMTATQMHEPDHTKTRKPKDAHAKVWLPESHWWKRDASPHNTRKQ